MHKGLSLHMGINFSSIKHYGSARKLNWCVEDAKAMTKLAYSLGYSPVLLTNEWATTNFFSSVVRTAAKVLNSGDTFLFTYSGHGAQLVDTNAEEPDGRDEAWVFHDRMLIDDELLLLLSEFKKGVKVITVSDCCHSGALVETGEYERAKLNECKKRARSFMVDESTGIVSVNQDCYINVFKKILDKRPDIKATVLQMFACEPNELAMECDKYRHGSFTESLLGVMKQGKFSDYDTFLNQVKLGIKYSTQSPFMVRIGENTHLFNNQLPFSL